MLNSATMEQNIVEHFDYQVVTAEVWKYLQAWYDCDYKICMRVIQDADCLRLDLHPEG